MSLENNSYNRRYFINEHYFNVIDNEEKAYFLGFLYADGNNDEKNYSVAINLQERDKELLEKFSKLINQDKPLTFIKKRKPTQNNLYKLIINSKIMSKKLSELGCVQRKSLILKFPTNKQVPRYLMKHFLRGLWDGDGSFCYYPVKGTNRYQMTTCVVSSKTFCLKLKPYLEKEIGVHFSMIRTKNSSTKYIQTSGMKQCMVFLDWLYDDAKIYLDRKFTKYKDIKIANTKHSQKLK